MLLTGRVGSLAHTGCTGTGLDGHGCTGLDGFRRAGLDGCIWRDGENPPLDPAGETGPGRDGRVDGLTGYFFKKSEIFKKSKNE